MTLHLPPRLRFLGLTAALAALLTPVLAHAGSFPIRIDGEFVDWAPTTVTATDPAGDDGGSGIDFTAITVANDQDWLYIRSIWNVGGVWSLPIPDWLLLGATLLAVPLITLWMFWPGKVRGVEIQPVEHEESLQEGGVVNPAGGHAACVLEALVHLCAQQQHSGDLVDGAVVHPRSNKRTWTTAART